MDEPNNVSTGSSAADDVRAAISQLKGETPAPGSSEISPAQIPPSAGDSATGDDSTPQVQARSRDDLGRFAPKTVEAKQPPAQQQNNDAGQSSATATPASQPEGAPRGWSAEAKAKWSSLDPSIRAEVLRREKQTDEAGVRWSGEKRAYDAVLQPMAAMAKATGLTPVQGVEAMMAVEMGLRNPQTAHQTLMDLARAYGIDLSKPPTEQPQRQPQADPIVAQLSSRLSGLESQLLQKEVDGVAAIISDFAKDKPHWDEIEDEMFHELSMLRQREPQTPHVELLQRAYDRVTWGTPSIRDTMLADRQNQASAEQNARQIAEKARRGAVSVNGGPSGAPMPQKQDYETVQDAARAAWRQHSGRH